MTLCIKFRVALAMASLLCAVHVSAHTRLQTLRSSVGTHLLHGISSNQSLQSSDNNEGFPGISEVAIGDHGKPFAFRGLEMSGEARDLLSSGKVIDPSSIRVCMQDRTNDAISEFIDPLTKGYFARQLDNMVPCNLLPLQRTELDGTVSKFSFFAPYSALITVMEWILNMFGCLFGLPELDLQELAEYVLALAEDPTAVFQGGNFLDFTPADYEPGFLSEGDTCWNWEDSTVTVTNCLKPCCHIESDDGSGKVWFVPCTSAGCQPVDTSETEFNCIARDSPCKQDSDCCQYPNKEMLCIRKLTDGLLDETGTCEEAEEQPYGWNPFCAAWNKPDDSNDFDTFGFTFAKPFPPFVIDPFPKKFPGTNLLLRNSFFPKANLPKTKFGPSPQAICDLYKGFKFIEDGTFLVGTLKFYGFALSTNNRLEFGANKWTRAVPGSTTDSVPRLWDGFLSVPFAPRPGIDFWLAFRFTFLPKANWELGRTTCANAPLMV